LLHHHCRCYNQKQKGKVAGYCCCIIIVDATTKTKKERELAAVVALSSMIQQNGRERELAAFVASSLSMLQQKGTRKGSCQLLLPHRRQCYNKKEGNGAGCFCCIIVDDTTNWKEWSCWCCAILSNNKRRELWLLLSHWLVVDTFGRHAKKTCYHFIECCWTFIVGKYYIVLLKTTLTNVS